MIAEFGHFALALALVISLAQATLPLIGAQRGDAVWVALARPFALGQFLCIAVAFAALTYAYLVSDFSVVNVARNSHSAKPLLYKISGVWGNHEGSMVLWVLMLSLFGLLVALAGNNLPPTLRARVLAIQAWIGAGFLAFILLTSNPFERIFPPPVDGNGLNPILQDPGLAFHPPFLYLGYVGFSIAFSFAVAALIEGRVDPAWARWVRPWTLAAWCALTVGIALGSYWAYYELGWGGWWFWDPVENASFMPWLAGTALLHSAAVAEKRDALKSWTILLAIIAFSLSLIGTFLVRSGVLTSVHAFATDPQRGLFILLLLVVAIGGSLTLYAIRAPRLKLGGLFHPVSREGGLVLNNLLLSTALATVFLGTLYPLFLDAIGAGKVSVGAPYFNTTFVPVMVPLVAAMAIGPMLAWKRGDLAGALGRLKFAFATAVAVTALCFALVARGPVLAPLGIGLATWVIAASLLEFAERIQLFTAPAAETWRRMRNLPRASYGMTIAHAGMGIAIIGMVAVSAWRVEVVQAMRPGDIVAAAGFTLRFEGMRELQGPNYRAEAGSFTVTRNGGLVTRLDAERRFFTDPAQLTTEAAIRSTLLGDLYVAIGDEAPGQMRTVRVWYNPLVVWIWLGAVIMALGGVVSLSDRRLRIGAPARRRAAVPAGAASAGA
ncbi:MAG: heme lyase CcmF/NrfE family subunit [Alphaproteobacteria bacterium]|nr:heme lyase CcmF/NrfE family subunit [Alphaproteobacteria bacterium]